MIKEESPLVRNAAMRKLYTRYYNQGMTSAMTSGKNSRQKTRRFSPAGRISALDESVDDSPTENGEFESVGGGVAMKNLFLMELPDGSLLVFYPNGQKAISRTSTNYTAIYDNVSESVDKSLGKHV